MQQVQLRYLTSSLRLLQTPCMPGRKITQVYIALHCNYFWNVPVAYISKTTSLNLNPYMFDIHQRHVFVWNLAELKGLLTSEWFVDIYASVNGFLIDW